MKKLVIWMCILILLALPGCAQTSASPTTTLTIDPPKQERVYPGAVEDYLNPVQAYSRPRKEKPEFVMLHFTSAVMLSKDDPYNIRTVRSIFRDYEVSIHYIVDRDGTVRCYIPEDREAWHAGSGTWGGDPKYTDNMNAYAIGIEILAIGSVSDMAQYLSAEAYAEIDPTFIGYTEEQYVALEQLVADICTRYDIPLDRQHIIGHQEYSPQKADPGELFDWNRIVKEQG